MKYWQFVKDEKNDNREDSPKIKNENLSTNNEQNQPSDTSDESISDQTGTNDANTPNDNPSDSPNKESNPQSDNSQDNLGEMTTDNVVNQVPRTESANSHSNMDSNTSLLLVNESADTSANNDEPSREIKDVDISGTIVTVAIDDAAKNPPNTIELSKNECVIESAENMQKQDKLTELRDKLLAYQKKKVEIEQTKKHRHNLDNPKDEVLESNEKSYELTDETNNFLNSLKDLPDFKARERSPGYAIDTEGYTEVSESIIRTLINKFLTGRFCKKDTDLNIRNNSMEKSPGFYKWEIKDVITHLETHQVTKVLNDKYGYKYAEGKNETIPLSFYFDMSGSMSNYTNLLAVIAIELLKKKIKVLIGFNERINVQIDQIKDNIDVETLAKVLASAGYYYPSDNNQVIKDERVTYKHIHQNIDNYLIAKKCQKCVVFSDFDPYDEICNLANKIEVYWFCFEQQYSYHDLKKYHGFVYKVNSLTDIANGLIKVNTNKYKALCYTNDENKTLRRK